MKWLCDENMGDGIIDWLRDRGHDVFWAYESARGASDAELLVRAVVDQRVVQIERFCVGHVVTVKINDVRVRPLA